MVKPPKIRHSKTQRDPVTIELEPGSVSRVSENPEAASISPETDAANEPVSAEDIQLAGLPGADAASSDADGAKESDWVSFDQPEKQTEDAASKPSSRSSAEFGRTETEQGAEATSSVPPVAPRQPRQSGFSGLVAGLLGGVIALTGVGGLQYAGLWPSSAPAADDAGQGAVMALQSEMTGLRDRIAELQSNAGSGVDVEGLRKSFDESTARVDGLSTTVEQVKTEVTALKSAVESGGAGENAGLQALQTKIAEIEKSIAALGQAEAGAAPADVSAIGDKLAAVETAVNAATTAASANDGRIGTIEKGLQTLEQSVTSLTGKVDAQASQPKVALAIAASALKTAVDAGGSIASEVEAFAAVAPDAPELADLRALAEKGVPSRTEIQSGSGAAVTAMVDAGRTVDENAGYFERLLSSAESLVKIRPVGPVEGTGVPEIAARLEAAIGDGDYAKAIAEYETLPEGPKAAGQAFMEQVRARLAAEQLVEKATAGALKA
ncbi:Uncharacterized conserved protein [Mesorhizobium albiziae]|uniref:Uncharacterized conserved protein n=1 Tax=Neomesorhizobium albiziae TaxID=335020 RepID=A0A1I3Y0X0_9HYPH|nr:phage tail protein [Mesorhizobium albiziae]GLS30220.1 tail protein [Mesorhizobium albiziae]SFK24876.1 Uncharacterized conserved protein [Mesorhizobium albiziae]